MSDPTVKPPPYNLRAEQVIIGAVLLRADAYDDLRSVFSPDDLYEDGHRRAWAAIEECIAAGDGTDVTMVFARLKARKDDLDSRGIDYLEKCKSAAVAAGSAVPHAREVRRLAKYQRLIHAAHRVIRDAHDKARPPDELAATAEQEFLDITGSVGGDDSVPVADLIRRRFDIIDAGGDAGGIPSGLGDLDAVTGGFFPQEYVIVGARPSQGKTALGLTIAANVAASGTPVLFLSLEMGKQQIADRLLAMRSGVPMMAFTARRPSDQDADKLVRAGTPIRGEAPIHVFDRSDITAAEIASVVRRHVRKKQVGLVVLDYIGLVMPADPKQRPVDQVTDISRRLKSAAKMSGVPMICLAQLNRKSEDRDDGRPKVSDLRDSGSLEQDADKVILIHRKPAPAGDGPPPVADETDLIVGKSRNGMTGDVTVMYLKKAMRFECRARGSGY